MTQPQQQTIADLALDELSTQLSFTMKALAISNARIQQLESFIRANADKLGLQEITAEEAERLAAEQQEPVSEEPEGAPETNGKARPLPTAKKVK